MVKRGLIRSFSLLAVLMIALASVGATQAALAFQATPPAAASYSAGTLLRVKVTIPYAWLRSTPTSNGATLDTAQTGELLIAASPAPQWDGSQWWWAVRRGNGSITGWIEQNSIELAIQASVTPGAVASATPGAAISSTPVIAGTPPSAGWSVTTTLVIAAKVPFAWVRDTASSNGATRGTLYPGIFVNVRDANPVWDGVQWWWLVNVPAYNIYGYIEEHSLQVAPLNQATPTFSATTTAIVTSPAVSTPTALSNPASTPNSAAATWPSNSSLSITAGIPFVWLRTTPSSNAPVVTVVYLNMTSQHPFVVVNSQPQWDGVQWWWYISTSTQGGVQGWVEQNSLQLVTATVPATPSVAATAAPWSNSVVRVRASVPYSLIRTTPSSNAPSVATVTSGSLMLTRNSAQWDGVQWWWSVQTALGQSGWVEQNSLELVTTSAMQSNGLSPAATGVVTAAGVPTTANLVPLPSTMTPTPTPTG